MRFELTVALKYLIPKWRQLSVSIISLISILVISLVVWLVVLFLSVTDGIERKWTEELVALNAPIRMTPTEAYYQSYYYLADSISSDSNYTLKSIGEKVLALNSDPYDPTFDRELPPEFPLPDIDEEGHLKDPVKGGFAAILSLRPKGITPREFEVNFGNLHLQLLREDISPGEIHQTLLTQVSYISSHDPQNKRVAKMLLPSSPDDYNNLLAVIGQTSSSSQLRDQLQQFFSHLSLQQLQTTKQGFELTPAFFPESGSLQGIGIVSFGSLSHVIIPQSKQELSSLNEKLTHQGYKTTPAELLFEKRDLKIISKEGFIVSDQVKLQLDAHIPFKAHLIDDSLKQASSLHDLQFQLDGEIQQIPVSGQSYYENLELATVKAKENGFLTPFWVYPSENGVSPIPSDQPLGDGILISKHFQNSGVRLGDRGYLAYYSQAGSSMHEQRIPVYVSGFYDPGMMPIGNKLLFVDPKVTAMLRGNMSVADQMLGNGINVWLDNLDEATQVKKELIAALQARGIDQYWNVQSFHDYEFTRPILEQLQSDKNLFTLIAFIILLVACSNIISMLILLVNDKKREIGILQSMGASSKRIATIFGLCGFLTGLLSCIIGTAAAIFTLQNLQSLIDLLSFLQGRDAFQAAFYGNRLPNDLSYSALIFVLGATMVISLIAGIVPAIKAARIRPTEILKSE